MKLLFIQGGTRLKCDIEGNWYTDGNFNDYVWKRYCDLCDHLTVILRRETLVYQPDDAKKRFNKFNTKAIKLISVEDLYRPVYKLFNFRKRKKVYKEIYNAVNKTDKVIIRSVVNYYTVSALKICRKLNKPYLIEVTGVAWDGSWYHSLRGKLTALFTELGVKRRLKNSPYAVYVTQNELQKRYPCRGKTLGCSDVELISIDKLALEKRLSNISDGKTSIIIGTIGGYELKTKGQKIVIKALSELNKQGIHNIKYQLIGGGNPNILKVAAQKLGVDDQVEFLGSIPHTEIFEWLDKIDIYIQPSYQEGLCRSVVEAMSRACPVICSDACGERELADETFIFKRGKYKKLAEYIKRMNNKEVMIDQAKRSFQKSFDYRKDVLDSRREKFYLDFINS